MAPPREKPVQKQEKGPFADVVVELPVDGAFTYLVPPQLVKDAGVGMRVLVPFGKRSVTGYIVKIKKKAGIKKVKEIVDLLDERPLFDVKRLKFFLWLSSYYFAYPGEALALIHPKFVNVRSERLFTITPEGRSHIEGANGSSLSESSLDLLKAIKGGARLKSLVKRYKGVPVRSILKGLKESGLAAEEVRLRGGGRRKFERFYKAAAGLDRAGALEGLKRAPVQAKLLDLIFAGNELSFKAVREEVGGGRSALKALMEKGLVEESLREAGVDALDEISPRAADFELNVEQKKAVGRIKDSIKEGGFSPYLLYGVTGSGKTLVYLKAVEEALKLGKKALVLVPEIALTPRAAAYLTKNFPGRVALMHSALGEAERFYQWQRIMDGKADVVVGTRSALFSPIKDLALIIVDEEHETSYKQEEGVRYSARDCALMLARSLGATVVLGSATPSVETFHNAQTGKITPLALTRRVLNKSMPGIEIMDMKPLGKSEVFSRRLLELIGKTLEEGEQTLLFLNRRGFSNFMICSGCGSPIDCPNCSVTLTLHKGAKRLRCHYCDLVAPIPEECPHCGGSDFDLPGSGTEKVEEELRLLFPQARIGRMDRDTTRRKGAAGSILDAMDSGELDILIGTQMVSKGHDFPGITLVGVINADTSLNIPDFRGSERTFQLIAQAAGRAGRG